MFFKSIIILLKRSGVYLSFSKKVFFLCGCATDKLFWEVGLANSIVPEKCSIKISKVRAELKMKKEEVIHWTDFEVEKSNIRLMLF